MSDVGFTTGGNYGFQPALIDWGHVFPSPRQATLNYRCVKNEQAQSGSLNIPIGAVEVNLAPLYTRPLVPGGVQFSMGGTRYYDGADGILYRSLNPATGIAVVAGTVDYQARQALITSAGGSVGAVTLEACLIGWQDIPVYRVTARITITPLKPGITQFQATTLDGRSLTGQDDGFGAITGLEMTGTLNYQSGIYQATFGKKVVAANLSDEEKTEPWYDPDLIDQEGKIFRPTAVLPSTFTLATVGYTYLPLSAEILQLDPARLPLDGRIQIFRPGDVAVIHHTASASVTPQAGVTTDLGRVRLARIAVTDDTGATVPALKFTVDLDAGTVTWANPLDITGYPTPWHIAHTIEEAAVVTDVTIDGKISLNLPLSHNFPDGSVISGAVLATQDLWARTSIPFTQKTWTNVWSDARIGDDTVWSYDDLLYPLEVTNIGCRQERWVCIFESSTTYKVIGERSGQIAQGIQKNADFAPINPATLTVPGGPYYLFILRAGGWGGGQSQGDCFRFNTYAANYPLALIRSIQPGPSYGLPSNFRLAIRGNVNQ